MKFISDIVDLVIFILSDIIIPQNVLTKVRMQDDYFNNKSNSL